MFNQKFKSLLDVVKYFPDETTCRNFLAKARWGNKPVCVKCGSFRKIYSLREGKVFRCADCGKEFTVRVGTIFEDSALPLQKWFMAIYLLTAHKKGISSMQLSRDIEVTQKTAWFMLHRIRWAVKTKSLEKPLKGVFEIDETYIGGKTTGKGTGYTGHKTPVFGMLQRNGVVRAEKVEKPSGKTLKPIILKTIHSDSVIMSDTYGGYKGLKHAYKGHHTVNHIRKEYVRGRVHTNTIEGFWSLLKRGVIGIYHHVSPKHLDRYVDEFEFRYNSRHISDTDRFKAMLNFIDGRLMYKNLIEKQS